MVMEMDDEDLYAHGDIDWIVVKGTDIEAVVEALELSDRCEGTSDDIEEAANTLIIPTWNGWIVIIHAWEPRGSSALYLNAIEEVVIKLSQNFGEAQSFASYEDNIFYAHWILAKDGVLIRSYATASETDLYRNFGEITEAEHFIDWSEDEFIAGSPEVLKVARQWSLEPVYTEHPDFQSLVFDGIVGVVGRTELQIP